jgi:hypothetical protein
MRSRASAPRLGGGGVTASVRRSSSALSTTPGAARRGERERGEHAPDHRVGDRVAREHVDAGDDAPAQHQQAGGEREREIDVDLEVHVA